MNCVNCGKKRRLKGSLLCIECWNAGYKVSRTEMERNWDRVLNAERARKASEKKSDR